MTTTLIVITPADRAPVTRADLMAQLDLDATADAAQLARLDQMIADATSYVEREANIILAPTDLELRLDCWPTCRRIPLEAAPVRGVDALAYVDADGVDQLVDLADWRFEPTSSGGELWLAQGFSTPALATWPGSLRVQFAAGFNLTPTTGESDGDPRLQLPGPARQAVIALAARWYLDRTLEGTSSDLIDRLIFRVKRFR